MPKPLSDNRRYRAMTVDQADQLFQEIALLTVRLSRIKAVYEKKIAELKAAADLWKVYRQNEKLPWFKAVFFFSCYAFNAIKKRICQ